MNFANKKEARVWDEFYKGLQAKNPGVRVLHIDEVYMEVDRNWIKKGNILLHGPDKFEVLTVPKKSKLGCKFKYEILNQGTLQIGDVVRIQK